MVPDGTDPKMLKIFSVILSKRAKGKPGQIVEINSHGILVAAKKDESLLNFNLFISLVGRYFEICLKSAILFCNTPKLISK